VREALAQRAGAPAEPMTSRDAGPCPVGQLTVAGGSSDYRERMTDAERPRLVIQPPAIWPTLDRTFWLVTAAGSLGSLIVFGLVAAIIPNPIFGRIIPPDGASIAIWLLSAPLMGALLATYVARIGSSPDGPGTDRDRESGAFTVGGLAAFFAIGCPVCNKLVLLALGTSGALNVFAPIQPLIGVASLVILGVTLRWRLRRRAAGCAIATG